MGGGGERKGGRAAAASISSCANSQGHQLEAAYRVFRYCFGLVCPSGITVVFAPAVSTERARRGRLASKRLLYIYAPRYKSLIYGFSIKTAGLLFIRGKLAGG